MFFTLFMPVREFSSTNLAHWKLHPKFVWYIYDIAYFAQFVEFPRDNDPSGANKIPYATRHHYYVPMRKK